MKNRILLLILLVFSSMTSFANGKIIGKIVDGSNNEGMVAVTVSVFKQGETTELFSTMTDIDGRFEFEVPEGLYEVKTDYLGYLPKIISDIKVTNGAAANITITLSDKAPASELETVVVRGNAKKETINAIYIQQKNAATVSDGISADVIAKSPDRSTGEALKRVSGTTIQDNKFVIVRGMNDRYNVAMMDGAILPSTEPNRKAFSFDIIPTAMIDNIIITKSASPDLPGDFSGGVINILSKEIPDFKYTNISIGTNYNSVSTFKPFYSGYRTPTDFLGFDNGSRQLPSGFGSYRQMQDANFYNPNNQEQSQKYQSMLNNDYSVTKKTAMPGINFQLAHGRVFDLKNTARIGFNAGITYGHDQRIRPDVARHYDNYYYNDDVYNYKTNLGLIANFGYYKGNSKILWKNLYNRIFDDNFIYREGLNTNSSTDIIFRAYDLIQKSLLKSTLIGEHKVGGGQNRINWLLSYNLVENNQPDQRKITYSRMINTTGDRYAELSTLGKANSRLFGDLKEHIANAGVSFSHPIKLFNSTNLKYGVQGQLRYRDFQNRYLGVILNQSNPDANNVIYSSLDQIFSPQNIANSYFTFKEQTNDGDFYDALSTTTAAYAMMDNMIGQKLRLVSGVRFEHFFINLNTLTTNEVKKQWSDLLPSVNLTYLMNDKSNLRTSYFRSLVRPELRELASLAFFDYEMTATITGNPALKPTSIHNLDLKFEYFPNPGEILSASVFYKHFTNTIENYVYTSNNSYDIKPENFAGGNNLGLELEIRKKLDFISQDKLFRNLNFYTNIALVKSQIELPANYTIQGIVIKDRALTGQSPLVINSSIGYQSENGKFGANFLYNYIGQRLFLIGNDRIGNVYEIARHIFDFQASYNISEKAAIRLTARDLFNSTIGFYTDQNVDGKYQDNVFNPMQIDIKNDWKWSFYKPGTTIGISFNYKF